MFYICSTYDICIKSPLDSDRLTSALLAEVQFLEFCFEWLPQSRPARVKAEQQFDARESSPISNSCKPVCVAGTFHAIHLFAL